MTKVTLTIETSEGTETYTQETDRYGKFVLPLVFSCVKTAVDKHKGEFEIAAAAVKTIAEFAGICTPVQHEYKPAETKCDVCKVVGGLHFRDCPALLDEPANS